MLKNVHETQWQDMHPAWQEVHAHKHGNQHSLLISNTPATLFHLEIFESKAECNETLLLPMFTHSCLFTSKVAFSKHASLFLPT